MIELTDTQKDIVDWAFGGMEGLPERDQKEIWGHIDEDDNFRKALDENSLDLSKLSEGQIEDLLWLIGEQYIGMAEDEYAGNQARINSKTTPAENIVKKIKEAV